jgi:sterol carrier protein 2
MSQVNSSQASQATKKGRRVFVVGVGMTRFRKPLKKFTADDPDYPEYVSTAVNRALDDCDLSFKDIEAASVGSVFSTGMGQRALYEMGMDGIPIFNVANACATGSNALFMMRSFVAGGMNECCLAVGVDIMKPGPLGAADATKGPKGPRKANSMDGQLAAMVSKFPIAAAPINPQMFGNAGREHNEMYGSNPDHFAAIGEKNHRHSINNPYSQFRDQYTHDEIKASRMIYAPLTKLQCSPTSDGAAAAILCSEDFVKKHGLEGNAVEIIGQAMKTDMATAWEKNAPDSCIKSVGFDMAKSAAQDVYAQAGITANDVQVVELHDCFSCNELLTYEAIGLAKEGEGHKLVDSGNNTFGGKFVVNPSGGLISKGHPLGATGVAQCAELNWQLRGECGPRQVKGAKVALQHNLGLGGNVVVTAYRKPAEWGGKQPKRRAPSRAMGVPGMQSRL